jgi:nucleoside-diphosphate-sugar epimerase
MRAFVVCVTGGTGFIGRSLVARLLADGHRVRVLTRGIGKHLPAEVEIFRGDLGQPDCFLEDFLQGANLLFHCAAELMNSSRYHLVNVDGTARLLGAARGRVKRWVQLSSVGVYGPIQSGIVTEDSLEAPVNTYERSKSASDELVRVAARDGVFEAVLLRPSNVYGEGMNSNYLRQMCSVIQRGWFIYIGPPGSSVSFVHVNDVVQALLLCGFLPQAAGRTYNLSGYDTLESLVECLAAALDCSTPRLRLHEWPVRLLVALLGQLPGFPLTTTRLQALTCRVRYDQTRIAEELGYLPAVGLVSGMAAFARRWHETKK